MIFHLATREEWEAPGPYRPISLTEDGFIHCSTAAQLIDVANDRYAGRADLLLLTIDPDQLSAPVVYEDCYETGRRFPHVYGVIDEAAVIGVDVIQPDTEGRFTWESLLRIDAALDAGERLEGER